MLSAVAQTTKQTGMQELARRTTGMVAGTTTGAGSSTTAVDSGMAGFGDRHFAGWWILLTSGTYSGHFRQIDDYTSSTGTFTWLRALAGGSGSSVTYELYKHDPRWLTQAMRDAVQWAYPALSRPMTLRLNSWTPDSRGVHPYIYKLPTVLDRVRMVEIDDCITEEVDEEFTSGLGSLAATTGSWAAASGKMSSTSDNDLDVIIAASNPDLYDGWAQAVVEGTYGAAADDYRTPAIVFRYLDASNFLAVGLVHDGTNESVSLSRISGGTATTITSAAFALTDGRQYELTVQWVGWRVEVWVDGVQYIDATLTETERKYENGGQVGIYLAKSGSPGTAAYVDRFRAHRIALQQSLTDWGFERGILRTNHAYSDARLLTVHGMAPISAPALDTTEGQMASLTTSVYECAITDPEWELIMKYASAVLYSLASAPGNALNQADRDDWRQRASDAFGVAQIMRPQFKPQRLPVGYKGLGF